jgi:tetratricopeptide (TPR) repeat protein
MSRHLRAAVMAGVVAVMVAGCASAPRSAPAAAAAPPRYTEFPMPTVPAGLNADPAVRERHQSGWSRLQSGDLRGASRDFSEALKRAPGFYPAQAGLGFVALADRQWKQAATRFTAAVDADARYLPAWLGLLDAQVALGHYDEAIAAGERVLSLDAKREDVRSRLDLLRLRQVQGLIESGRKARLSGRHQESLTLLNRALGISPNSAAILTEIAATEFALGDLEEAEAHARKALAIDASDADSHAALATILEARKRVQEASAVWARAAAIDSKYRERANRARDAAAETGLPDELRDLPERAVVTRADVAALLHARLAAVVARAPKRAPQVATDIRTHWAVASIMAVTQAGFMDVSANHTFQPGASMRRVDLANVIARVVPVLLQSQPGTLKTWQSARPAFADLPASNASYRAAALAVTAGALALHETNRFEPARPATGAEAVAAIARLEQLAGGR